MKFIITRTSDYEDASSPCAEAKEDQVVRIETRALYSPEEFDKKFADREGNWLSVGTNHRIGRDGHICRDREMMNVWTIEISSIEELVALSRKYGEIIIADHYLNDNDGYPTLEIYDDYRE